MIVVLTQTYGNDRKELYDIRSKDSLLQYFISQFDHDIYSFHNCSKETIEYYKSKNTNKEYVEYVDIPYTHTIYHLIDKLSKIGCTKLIFLQDDVFTWNQTKEDIDVLVNKIKNGNFPLLNMEMKFDEFKDELKGSIKIIEEENDVKFYKAFTLDFSKNGGYSFDDAPFVIDFDYINVIFDNQFFQIGDVWRGELYNNDKFKLINFPRYLTNKKFFKRYNILGRNAWNRNQEIIDLNKNFLSQESHSKHMKSDNNLCDENCTSPCDWHRLELDFISKNIDKDDYVVDLGSYTGEHLDVLINLVNPSQITGIEMDLYNYNNLLNKYSSSGIKIINCAVSDKNDRISYFSGNGGCPNIFGQHENNSFVGYKIGEVDCYTLDYLFNNQKIDVLKMDIEGAEYQALSGGKNVLKQCKFIMIECHTESEFSKINKLLIEDLEKDVYCLKYLHKKTIDSPFSYQIVAVNKKYEIVNGKINLKDESR